jgi:F0F1-type ATP synthase delta subunit
MRHDPKAYAKALAAVAAGPLAAKQEQEIVKNFTRIVTERAGRTQWPKFIAAAEKALREKTGVRKVTIESARPLKDAHGEFKKLLKPSDVIEEKVDLALVAGVKITIDDSRQYDGSLRAKLNKLF